MLLAVGQVNAVLAVVLEVADVVAEVQRQAVRLARANRHLSLPIQSLLPIAMQEMNLAIQDHLEFLRLRWMSPYALVRSQDLLLNPLHRYQSLRRKRKMKRNRTWTWLSDYSYTLSLLCAHAVISTLLFQLDVNVDPHRV